MAVVTLDGIEGLDPVQAFQFRTSSGEGLVRYGLVLNPIAHDLSGDTALVRQLCAESAEERWFIRFFLDLSALWGSE